MYESLSYVPTYITERVVLYNRQWMSVSSLHFSLFSNLSLVYKACPLLVTAYGPFY